MREFCVNQSCIVMRSTAKWRIGRPGNSLINKGQVDFNVKTSCCGGSVAVFSPEKILHLIKEILQAAQDSGANVISTPCPLCQTNVEMYQPAINKKFGTDFNIPVVFYSQLMAKAFGLDTKRDAGLHRNTIRSKNWIFLFWTINPDKSCGILAISRLFYSYSCLSCLFGAGSKNLRILLDGNNAVLGDRPCLHLAGEGQ